MVGLSVTSLGSSGFWISTAVLSAYYGIFALGLQLNLGTTGLLNFGQTGFMAIGAYAMAIFVVREDLSFWLAIPLGICCSTIAALVLGLVSVRLKANFLAIATLAFAEIVRYTANSWYSLTGGGLGIYGYSTSWQSESRRLLGVLTSLGLGTNYLLPLLVVGWCLFALLTVGVWALTRTPWGRVLRAIREDENAAQALGKNTFLFKLQSFALAGALAGVAGYVFALDVSILNPDSFQSTFTVFALAIVVLGGLGSYLGVFVGTVILLVLVQGTQNIGLPLPDDKVAALRYIIVGVVLIAIIAVRPQGLVGNAKELAVGDD
jgi:branched-chain amino acid transport system permease protein